MTRDEYKIKTVVLRPSIDFDETEEIVENKKTSHFRAMLQKPKKADVHVHSIKLSYEAFLILSGKYKSNVDINYECKLKFEDEVQKYCYMWREAGQFSQTKYKDD